MTDMTKAELAEYLVNIKTLMEAQQAGPHSIPSTVLAAEYNRGWGQLKEFINKEQDDARQSTDDAERPQDGAARQGSEPRRSQPDRLSSGQRSGD